jgi:thiamine biosynthesis lipoprotein
MAAEVRFRAMGSDCHVIVVGGSAGAAACAQRRIDDLERKWSRFRDDSEVTALNRAAGAPLAVSAETVTLVVLAIAAWRLSGGAFDPTVLGAVVRAGYDRSFECIASRPGVSTLGLGAADIRVAGATVTLPRGVGFDPGGIGKGLAADMVVTELVEGGAAGACVNMGGDVRVSGVGPAGDGWTIAVEHPWSAPPLALVGVAEGAVATSTTLCRRWEVGGRQRHHLIDPRTGLPSDTDVNLAAVLASEAWVAEVLAKAVLLRGGSHPFDILGGTGANGLVVGADGRVQATAGWAAHMGNARLVARVGP